MKTKETQPVDIHSKRHKALRQAVERLMPGAVFYSRVIGQPFSLSAYQVGHLLRHTGLVAPMLDAKGKVVSGQWVRVPMGDERYVWPGGPVTLPDQSGLTCLQGDALFETARVTAPDPYDFAPELMRGTRG